MKIRISILITLLAVFLISSISGCTTNSDVKVVSEIPVTRQDIINIHNILDSNDCFIYYNKCMVDKKKDCWKTHEQCVILVYRKYELLKK